MRRAKKVYQATYRWPFQMHGMIGPSCAVADVQGGKATIWAGSQGPFARAVRRRHARSQRKDVRIIYREGSGCYGRLSADDGAEDAALLSRAVGAPVRVQWSRQDEHGWEPKGPAQLDEARAAVDGDGKLLAWDFADYSQPWTASGSTPLLASLQIGSADRSRRIPTAPEGWRDLRVANQTILAHHINWHFPDDSSAHEQSSRARDIARCFATEGFIDEIAADLKIDPVECRLNHLASNKRGAECLEAAVDKAQWHKRPSPAPATSDNIARGVA